ncbi:MAG: YCF48-related protein, partial [Hylemonella sp.]
MLLSACGGGGDGGGAPPPVPATAIPDTLSISGAASSDVASATAFSNSAASLQGLSFAWNFGDGSSSTEASPKHDYAKVGDYEVSLKVSNTAGASKEVKFQVSVNNRAHVRGLACSGASDSGWCWQQPRPTGTSREDYFFLDAQTAWSVGDNGEIFKTVDGGKTWLRQHSGLRSRLLAVGFADANNGWVIGTFGAVLRTVDGGKTWVQQEVGFTDSYSYRLHVLDARTAVVTTGDGRVRRTADGGASWTENVFSVSEVGADGTLWYFDGSTLKKSTDGGATGTTVATVAWGARFQLLGMQGLVLTNTSWGYDPGLGGYGYELSLRRSVDGGANWESYEAQGLGSDVSYTPVVSFVDTNNAYLSAGHQI